MDNNILCFHLLWWILKEIDEAWTIVRVPENTRNVQDQRSNSTPSNRKNAAGNPSIVVQIKIVSVASVVKKYFVPAPRRIEYYINNNFDFDKLIIIQNVH